MNRKADIKAAVKALEHHVDFNIDARVHVFETTIRVLGGLLSGHVLLLRCAGILADSWWAERLLQGACCTGAQSQGGRSGPAGCPGRC
jgi:hypothetical protein